MASTAFYIHVVYSVSLTNEQGTAPCWWILLSYIFMLMQLYPVSGFKPKMSAKP